MKVSLFFWFDRFLEARAEILEKISLFFGPNILKLTDLYKAKMADVGSSSCKNKWGFQVFVNCKSNLDGSMNQQFHVKWAVHEFEPPILNFSFLEFLILIIYLRKEI